MRQEGRSSRGRRVRVGCLRSLVAGAIVALAWTVVAAANHIGINERTPGKMQIPSRPDEHTPWSDLKPQYVRAIFEYNVATGANPRELERLNMWLDRVARVNAEPFVVLEGIGGKTKRKPGDRSQYVRNVEPFFRQYVDTRRVTLVGAWNEPNFKANHVPARLAARFYRYVRDRMRPVCRALKLEKSRRRCGAIAGELAGGLSPKNKRYLKAYARRIRRLPGVLGVHTYGDVRRYQLCFKDRIRGVRVRDRGDVRLLRKYDPRLCGRRGRGNGARELRRFADIFGRKMWLTETGASVDITVDRPPRPDRGLRRPFHKRIHFSNWEQCVGVSYISRLLHRLRIERIYYYRFAAGDNTQPKGDRGVVFVRRSPRRRQAFYRLAPGHRRCAPPGAAFVSSDSIGTSFGGDSTDQLLADVNGDGTADAVAYYQDGGRWVVAPSRRTFFDDEREWLRGHGAGSDKRLLGDVDGDGRADAVVFFDKSGPFAGAWYVARSSKTSESFDPPEPWIRGFGVNASKVALSDVNGDGKADAVAFYKTDGSWHVALSNGRSFDPPQAMPWISGHGVGSSEQGLDDVNGDDLPDAVVFFRDPGTWYVAENTGHSFVLTRTDPWISGYGSTSETQSLDDVDGDNAADVVTFYKPSGVWFVAPSAIDSFGRPVQWQGGHGAASDVQRVADVTGDDKGDAVAFTAGDGTWSVAPATP
jgi:FG-GAP-like repeat